MFKLLNAEATLLKKISVHIVNKVLVECCCALQPPVPSGATLIVAPHSITHQWVDEVLRHIAVDALQIFVSNC